MEGEYIGSKISLISNSDIRYEGILYSINSEDSTIALENVKSFGTEDRTPTNGRVVAANNNVFEYVVFRGSDVKDLTILENPNLKKERKEDEDIYNDPAILNASNKKPVTEEKKKKTFGTSSPTKGHSKKASYSSSKEVDKEPNKYDYTKEQQNNKKPHSSKKNSAKNLEKPKTRDLEEFDFSEANAKFDKTELVKDFNNIEISDSIEKKPIKSYKKTDSFFDNISSDVRDRNIKDNKNIQHSIQKYTSNKTNLETFGEAYVNTNKNRFHRGGRGYRGRGRSRGTGFTTNQNDD